MTPQEEARDLSRKTGVPIQTCRRWIDGKSTADLTIDTWITDHLLDLMRIKQKPNETFTLEEIGVFTGLTRERIRQIEKEALKKIRNKIHAVTNELNRSK
ncbi:MAG: sigma factor-like helix-turn-helix DNA-binding protein [Candidatus Poseidoniaceae archaeon]